MKEDKNKNKYDNFQFFDIWWRSTLPEVKDTADFLFKKLPAVSLEKFKTNSLKEHLKVILTNLNVVNKQDERRYIAISMTKGNYRQPKHLEKLYLKYEIVKFLIDFLKDNGFIEFKSGFKDGNIGRCSRIKCKKKLTRLFRKFRQPCGKNVKINFPLELRDENKNPVSFDFHTRRIKNIIQGVNRINRCISRHKIECIFNNIYEWQDYEINYAHLEVHTKYCRIFNNSDFNQGGRFYGHWSQLIKSDYRKYIHIDNQPVVELDYSCLHLFMLYCMADIMPPKGDLYLLKGIDPRFRKLIKKASLIIINSKTEREAEKAINLERTEWMKENIDIPPKPKDIIEAFKKTHPAIQDKFCSGMGIYLQNLDSRIAEKIMLTLAKQDICFLCIHDSFIVQEQHEELLFSLMTRYFYEAFGYKPRITRKKTKKSNKLYFTEADIKPEFHDHFLFDMAL